jgi:hypothetical protein
VSTLRRTAADVYLPDEVRKQCAEAMRLTESAAQRTLVAFNARRRAAHKLKQLGLPVGDICLVLALDKRQVITLLSTEKPVAERKRT